MSENYIIAGGDMRFAAAAERLSSLGKNVCIIYPCRRTGCESYMELGGISPADCLILPVPVTKDGTHLNAPAADAPPLLLHLAAIVKEGGTVFGGKFSPSARKIFTEKGIDCEDYMEREELSRMNALATAEGAVMTALQKQDIMLHGQKVLIIGMGRIGKCLAHILRGFGADITAAARKPADLAAADIMGCHTVNTSDIPGVCGHFSLIFNTAPAMMLNREVLSSVSKKTLIIDLASVPGGTDFAAAEELGITALSCTGIPGKTAANSAGALIADTVLNIIGERRNCNDCKR